MNTLGLIHMLFGVVALLAATASEITSRLPGTEENFGLIVAGTSIAVMVIGGILIQRFTPTSIRRLPARVQRAQ